MTSNLGAENFSPTDKRIGFAGTDSSDKASLTRRVLEQARSTFPPELWNRIENKQVFHPLTSKEIHHIAGYQIEQRSHVLEAERGIAFRASNSAIEYLIDNGGFEPSLGARPMRRAIAEHFETPMAKQILARRIARGDTVRIDCNSDGLVFEVIQCHDGEERISGSFFAADETWAVAAEEQTTKAQKAPKAHEVEPSYHYPSTAYVLYGQRGFDRGLPSQHPPFGVQLSAEKSC